MTGCASTDRTAAAPPAPAAPTAAAPTAPAATTPLASNDAPALAARPAPAPTSPPPKPHRPPATHHADQAFTPSADHSPILPDGATMTSASFHKYRGPDALPRLEVLSPVFQPAAPLTVIPQAVRVRTDPDALVAAYANQLGSFPDGHSGIVVRADHDGIAVIDVLIGNDVGDYPILVTSPARSGVVVVTLNAE